MKILLTTLNSKYIHSNLALKYLYESAGIYREQIEIKEFTINNDDMSIFMEIMRGNYDLICFSCYIWNISRIEGLIKDIKKAKPDTYIIVGGPEVSFETEKFLERNPEVDLVVKGEGDEVFFDVIRRFAEEEKSYEQVIIEAPAAEEENICFPYENSDIDPNKIVYYETARGCPYRCSFCLSSVSRGVRLFSLDRVYRELDYFLKKKVKQVKFVDRTFNIDLDRAAAIMNHIIDNDNGVTNFHFELCGDRMSEEMLSAFARARTDLFQIEIGVQSAQPEVLEACNRKVDFEKLKE
ncbi:MAG: radical SAM protein, partial [Firmicutes bacterium]|nr:radical SAM protein [Bacillota bacterium]